MNQGLEILIARTKTHPEEFISNDLSNNLPKWVLMIQSFTRYATDEEKEAWQEAMTDLNKWHENKRRDDFTEAVMRELLVRDDYEAVRDDGVSLNSVSHPRPKQLITHASMTHDALTILAGSGGGGGNSGGYGGGNYPQGGGGGSVIVKTPTGTHTFTKNGVVTVKGDEQVTWLPKP